ncbi:hypothetical protein BD770DRAFT_475133 [Pilaira anomala]|nr:hypothetical protein BD770DRAFT_475133 [Pilaira anomala]
MGNNDNKIELESKDFFHVQEELKRLADVFVDVETSNETEREESKKELEQWLNKVWSKFPGNVLLTDNPNYNFNEPVYIREPLDEALQYEVNHSKERLQNAKKNLEKTRTDMIHLVSNLEQEALRLHSREVNELEIIPSRSEPKKEIAQLDKENTKEVERVYDESVAILAHLDKSVPEQTKKMKSIIEITTHK